VAADFSCGWEHRQNLATVTHKTVIEFQKGCVGEEQPDTVRAFLALDSHVIRFHASGIARERCEVQRRASALEMRVDNRQIAIQERL
jgi:hypothetical protein